MKGFLIDLTRPRATDPDEARVEYALRINLTILSSFSVVFTFIGIFAYWRSIILLDTLLIIFSIALFSSITWFFTDRGYWRTTRIVPVAVFFLVAAYGNLVGGIGAPAMLIYILSIVFAMQLYKRAMQYAVIAASILSYALMAVLHWKGVIAPPRAEAATFQNRIFIAVLIMLTIGALLRFIVSQLEKAIDVSRRNERELADANKALLAANKQYEAQNRELEKVNRELEKSEDNFRALFESAPIPVILHRHGTILFVNRAYVRMVGAASREALIGGSMYDYMVPEERTRIAEIIKSQQHSSGAPVIDETMGLRADGSICYCEINVAFVMLDDGPATLVFVRDITERKIAEREKERMQQQLLQAQKMEAVGTLTGGIAHDFNNMLAGIIGSLDLMGLQIEREKHPVNDALSKYIGTALESARRAADMTRQLLTLSRKSELTLSPVDVNLSLTHIRKLCQNSFPKSITLDFRIAEAPLLVHADPVQIEQALLNLCVNASHAMTIMRPENEQPGGVLSVSVEKQQCDEALRILHPDARPGTTYVMIRVSDNGVGMEEETRLQIFDPFFTTKGQQDGTGLGLAMVYGIVTQHKGFIHVYSEPGKGSAFNLFLPALVENKPKESKRAAGPNIVTGSGRILVVDDEQPLLQIARGMLEACGYEVICAEGGNKAIEIYRREHNRIHGVLLDLSMPGISGLEAFKRIKAINPDAKVLLTSGFMEAHDQKKAEDLGVKGFIQKPYSVEKLSLKIKAVLNA